MKYYKTEDNQLIQFNPETNVYRVRTNIEKKSTVITEEEFKALSTVEIKKQKFATLMNVYFKGVKHSWTYKNKNYRKLDNFETDSNGLCTNYDWYKHPRHNPKESTSSAAHRYSGENLLVYHWGKVYLFNWSYGGYPQGQLFDVNTGEMLRWAKPKHCAPIFDEQRKVIV